MTITRIGILGAGLMGGSIGLAARAEGIDVTIFDLNLDAASRAVVLGAADRVAADLAEACTPDTDIVFVAVPVSHVATAVAAALDAGAKVVTDVGSVKAPVVNAVLTARPEAAGRFVGGHPMAGSEQDGLDGAHAGLFQGATWVLTPTPFTDPEAFSTVRLAVAGFGAEVVAFDPIDHDALVAVVSHVPQLAATTLMDVAARRGEEEHGLLRLAAGGFRDMTRIAASHPAIWPDICVENRDAIIGALDNYVDALQSVRTLVAERDRDGLLALLTRARAARRNLPVGAAAAGPLVELRIPIPDRPGMLAEVTTLAGSLGINISDIETAHSTEGPYGVLILVVPAGDAERYETALRARDFHATRAPLT